MRQISVVIHYCDLSLVFFLTQTLLVLKSKQNYLRRIQTQMACSRVKTSIFFSICIVVDNCANFNLWQFLGSGSEYLKNQSVLGGFKFKWPVVELKLWKFCSICIGCWQLCKSVNRIRKMQWTWKEISERFGLAPSPASTKFASHCYCFVQHSEALNSVWNHVELSPNCPQKLTSKLTLKFSQRYPHNWS